MSEWISVKDKLPPKFNEHANGNLKEGETDKIIEVLVYVNEATPIITIGHATYSNHAGWELHLDMLDKYAVTHWMPLPEPPKQLEDK